VSGTDATEATEATEGTEAIWAGSMPEIYDRCLGPALFAPYARYLSQLAANLAPRRVLELAAGTGIVTANLVSALPDAHITATDLNSAMVEWAAERVPGPTWSVADAQHLEFADDTFDLVICQFGVMFFPDKPGAFAEVERVLSATGSLVFAVWDTVEGSDFPTALMASLAAVLPDDPPTFLTRVPHGYTDVVQIGADVEAGGLIVDRIERVVLRGHSSARALTEGFCRGTPLRFALEERGSLDALAARLEDEMVARLGDGPIEGDLAAIVVTARTPRQ
jgi:SAM-dependent methyltransferase